MTSSCMAVTSITIAELLVLHRRWTAMVDVSVIIMLQNNHTAVCCQPLKKRKEDTFIHCGVELNICSNLVTV